MDAYYVIKQGVTRDEIFSYLQTFFIVPDARNYEVMDAICSIYEKYEPNRYRVFDEDTKLYSTKLNIKEPTFWQTLNPNKGSKEIGQPHWTYKGLKEILFFVLYGSVVEKDKIIEPKNLGKIFNFIEIDESQVSQINYLLSEFYSKYAETRGFRKFGLEMINNQAILKVLIEVEASKSERLNEILPKKENITIPQLLLNNSIHKKRPLIKYLQGFFIPFRRKVSENLAMPDRNHLLQSLEGFITPSFSIGTDETIRKDTKEISNFLLEQILHSNSLRFIYILGESGVGKSLLLQKLFYEIRQKNINTPVFITPAKLLNAEDTDYKESLNESEILLIDSIDEVREFYNHPDDVLRDIFTIAENKKMVVFTCRTTMLDLDIAEHLRKIIGSSKYQSLPVNINEFAENEVEKYLNLRFKKNKDLKTLISNLIKVIEERNFDAFSKQWFLSEASNIAESLRIGSEIKYVYQLLDKLVEGYVYREIENKQLNPDMKTVVLNWYITFGKRLAVVTYNNPNRFDGFTIDEVMGDVLDRTQLEYILQRSFFGQTKEGKYFFKHLTWRDYFLAKTIYERKYSDFENSFLHIEFWGSNFGGTSNYSNAIGFYNEMVINDIICLKSDNEKVLLNRENKIKYRKNLVPSDVAYIVEFVDGEVPIELQERIFSLECVKSQSNGKCDFNRFYNHKNVTEILIPNITELEGVIPETVIHIKLNKKFEISGNRQFLEMLIKHNVSFQGN